VFINFLFELKHMGVPVSLVEWMTLMEALDRGLAFISLTLFGSTLYRLRVGMKN